MTEEALKRFNSIKDEDIDFSDAPRLTEEQLKNAKPLREIHPEWFAVKKKSISLRLDCDILDAFKSTGKGYQTKINDALREYLKEHSDLIPGVC